MNHPLNDSIERGRFLRFAAVGAIGTVVDFGVFNLLNVVFKIQPVAASILSFTTAVINNFLLIPPVL